jgi:hypothetical protein
MASLPRVPEITEPDFIERHLATRLPVIVTGEVPRWPAYRRWTWAYLVEHLGDRTVDIYDDWFEPTAVASFGEFVAANIRRPGTWKQRYVRWFSRHRVGDGHWSDDVFATLRADWQPLRFLPTSGYIVPCVPSPARIDPTGDLLPYRALFVSGAGARTRLHLDPWASSAVLCQVVGDKHVTMWPPEQHDTMLALSGQGLSGQECGVPPTFDDTLSAGEALFIPGGWWHEVDTVTDAVSGTWNFLHRVHAEALRAHIAAVPDDPELAVVTFFLGDGTTVVDAATLVEASIGSQATPFV